MSRCFQFPPPGCRVKETWREALIEKIKIQKQREKAKEEKRKRREEKQKRREKKEKTNQLLERSSNIEKVWVDTKDGHLYKERKDGSSLTEEYGLPTLLIPTPSSETESTENSSKRKRNSRYGDTIVLQLAVKKQKRDTLYNEKRTDILPQFKDEKICTISEGIGNNGRGFPQTDEAIKCSISEQIEATAQGKIGIQSSNDAYKNLFENWDPLLLLAVQLDPDDEDWLFRGKGQNIHSDKRLKSCSNSISIPCCSTLWLHSQFLPEADIYALPFTIPF